MVGTSFMIGSGAADGSVTADISDVVGGSISVMADDSEAGIGVSCPEFSEDSAANAGMPLLSNIAGNKTTSANLYNFFFVITLMSFTAYKLAFDLIA
jgi:hypothetical protein